MKIKRLFSIYIILILSSLVFARPKVALVLSGGGAKGLAEIPLLEALEREGIKPDMILGTSMGALIGSLYAAGYSAKEIREILLSMDYLKVLGERPVSLERVPPEAFSSRSNSDTALSFSINNKRIGSAPGLIGDQNIVMELSNHLSRVLNVDDFDKLSIPFRCIATNVSTGEQIVLKSGSLVDAVRASISLPGIFTPAPLGNGVFAMDGGLRNNLPVQLAREMGADIVIAMDVASILDTDPNTLSDFVTVTEQIINLIISSNAVEQYHLATLVLKPDLKKYGTVDFFHPLEIVAAGEKCVEENKEKLHEIAVNLSKQGYPISVPDYDRVSDYDRLPDLRIRKVIIKDVSFSQDGPLPRLRDFEQFEGKILDWETKDKLTMELKEKKNQYHLSNFSYSVEKVEGTDEYDLILKANHYDQELSKIFLSGTPSVSITNLPAQKYVTVNPASTVGINLVDPVDAMVRVTTGNIVHADATFYPKVASINGFKVSGEIGGDFKYGSLEPKNYFFFNDRLVDSDRGVIGNLGLRFKYTDMITLRLGVANEADMVISQDHWFRSTYGYNEIIYTTLHNNFMKLRGIQVESAVYYGKSNSENPEFDMNYSLRFAYEQRFELKKDNTSIGFGLSFCRNRFPYELNIGYNDYGGIEGMCGYPLGMLKRDFQIAEVSYRQRIFSFIGMPFYLILQGKVGVSDSYDPFYDTAAPDNKFLAGGKPEAGVGSYAAFSTPIGDLVLGYSINTSRKWVVTLGLK
ncbi:patatin-like phospholipase family protein [Treponema sp.]|uniref:patatin-like phospholipase family protein n=1 Tax=Treponema sp. TaxID=166 RepID=UPI003890EDE3